MANPESLDSSTQDIHLQNVGQLFVTDAIRFRPRNVFGLPEPDFVELRDWALNDVDRRTDSGGEMFQDFGPIIRPEFIGF